MTPIRKQSFRRCVRSAPPTMPPKVEGPTMIVVTTDEEFAMVHAAEGEQCSDAVKGFLHAALCTRGLRRSLRSQQCRSRQSVGGRHGRHACGTHARSLNFSLSSSRCVVEIFADWCGPSEAVLSTVMN